MTPPHAAAVWVCPFCGRNVPARVGVCYCGRERPAEPVRRTTPAQRRQNTAAHLKLTAAAVALALLTAGAWYGTRGRASTTTEPAALPRQPEILQPAMRAAASDDATAPPVAAVVASATPAVVMVQTPNAAGSGFFAGPDLIVTTATLMSGASSASITTHAGSRFDAKVVAVSDEHDLALLRAPQQNATPAALPLAHSVDVRLNQHVIALGWPSTTETNAPPRGSISGLRRHGDLRLLQTDIAPNAGDTGGPLIDRFGRVLGVLTTNAGGTSAVAIGIDDAKTLFDSLGRTSPQD